MTQLLPGEPVDVLECSRGWASIRTAYAYSGWAREESLANLPAADAWPEPSEGHDVLEAARAYLGAPYEWGGMSERGIDCSGLVHMAYRRLGTLVPRDAHQQEAAAAPVEEADARRGDLVCFGEPGEAHHIAFWLGDGRILHATGREGVAAVVEEPLADAGPGPIRFVRL